MVDALAMKADEGRGKPAISFGEVVATYEPEISEWENPFSFTKHFLQKKYAE